MFLFQSRRCKTVSSKIKLVFYFILAVLMVTDIYLIFNAGNPDSLLRLLVKDSSWDIFVTFVVSLCIVLISFLVFNQRPKEDDKLYQLLKGNAGHIRTLREKGRSDAEIAESFLAELKLKGPFAAAARKRVLKYLGEIE